MQCVSVARLKLSYYKAQVCSTSEHLLLPLRNMPRLRITDRVEIIMRDGDIRLSNRRGGTVYPVIRTWAFHWEQCIHDVPGLSADLHLTRMITWVIYYSEVDRAEANVIVLEDGHTIINGAVTLAHLRRQRITAVTSTGEIYGISSDESSDF